MLLLTKWIRIPRTGNQQILQKFLHVSWRTRKNHYDTLGVTRAASATEIKSAYFKLCKEYHPDKHSNDDRKGKKFLEINNAYSVLGSERSRKEYDARLFSPHSSQRVTHMNNPYHNPYARYQQDLRQDFEFKRPKDPLNAYWDRFYKTKKMKSKRHKENGSVNSLDRLQMKHVHYFLVFLFILLCTRYIAQKQSRGYQSALDELDLQRMDEAKEKAFRDHEKRKRWKKEQCLKNETELEEA